MEHNIVGPVKHMNDIIIDSNGNIVCIFYNKNAAEFIVEALNEKLSKEINNELTELLKNKLPK